MSAAIDHPRIDVGEYTYASAHNPPSDWAASLAPYLYDFSPERLIIGRYCQIASGVQFITASANHRFDGFSSFPFAVFDGPLEGRASMPEAGADTVIGNDVWIGTGAMIMPGAQLGDGVIVAAGAVVAGNVPAYTIVAGNPARHIRQRFQDEIVSALLKTKWWNWPIEHVLANEAAICGADLSALEAAAASLTP
nr:CatB-related O-acetyltransferase [Lentibacter algarum]